MKFLNKKLHNSWRYIRFICIPPKSSLSKGSLKPRTWRCPSAWFLQAPTTSHLAKNLNKQNNGRFKFRRKRPRKLVSLLEDRRRHVVEAPKVHRTLALLAPATDAAVEDRVAAAQKRRRKIAPIVKLRNFRRQVERRAPLLHVIRRLSDVAFRIRLEALVFAAEAGIIRVAAAAITRAPREKETLHLGGNLGFWGGPMTEISDRESGFDLERRELGLCRRRLRSRIGGFVDR